MKRLRVIERKLGRHGALGFSYGDGTIEIDPRQPPKEYLDTAIHECLHEALSTLSEEQVTSSATLIANTLWRLGFRRVLL